jgi:hypothetical protein
VRRPFPPLVLACACGAHMTMADSRPDVRRMVAGDFAAKHDGGWCSVGPASSARYRAVVDRARERWALYQARRAY